MTSTLYYLVGTCLPGFLLGSYWGFARAGLNANLSGYRARSQKWHIRLIFEPSSALPLRLQLVYGLVLFFSFWVVIFLLIYPMVLLANPPAGILMAELIFAPFLLYPLVGYKGYILGRDRCFQIIKKYN